MLSRHNADTVIAPHCTACARRVPPSPSWHKPVFCLSQFEYGTCGARTLSLAAPFYLLVGGWVGRERGSRFRGPRWFAAAPCAGRSYPTTLTQRSENSFSTCAVLQQRRVAPRMKTTIGAWVRVTSCTREVREKLRRNQVGKRNVQSSRAQSRRLHRLGLSESTRGHGPCPGGRMSRHRGDLLRCRFCGSPLGTLAHCAGSCPASADLQLERCAAAAGGSHARHRSMVVS